MGHCRCRGLGPRLGRALFVVKGVGVRAEISSELIAEQITTGADARIPGVLVDGITLRTALNQAAMGFGITGIAIGAGIIILLGGAMTVLHAAPALNYVANLVVTRKGTWSRMAIG